MTLSVLCLGAGALAIRFLLCSTRTTNHPLSSIPGPFLARYSNLWRLLNALSPKPYESQMGLHHRHASKFVRVGPNTIAVSDLALIHRIYGPNSGLAKSDFYTVFMTPYRGQFTPSIFNTVDDEYHGKIKRPIAGAYSMAIAQEWEPKMDDITALFLKRLDRFAKSGEAFNLTMWLQMYAFDVSGQICFSKRFGFLDTATDIDGIIKDIEGKLHMAGVIGQIAWLDKLSTKNSLYAWLAPTHPIVKFCVDCMNKQGDSRERTNVGERGRDFLTRCFEAQAKYPGIVTDRLIRTYNVDNIIAGSGTLGTALSAVQSEIDNLPHLPSELLSYRTTRALPYLQATIQESMRLHPIVGILMERVVPSGGVTSDDQYFPAGTIISCNPWVVHRDKDLYGSDANTFRPERWLGAPPEKLRAMERASLAFGSGARVCTGRNIALVEMSKLVPELLKRYEFRMKNEERVEAVGGWFVSLKGFDVLISKRI